MRAIALASGLALTLMSGWAQAALFEDEDARKAILELRSKQDATAQRLSEQEQASQQLRRSMLELNASIDVLKGELAQLRGQKEQLQREVSELQRRQKDVVAGVEDRVRRLEPQKVQLDGQEFLAEPEEIRLMDLALNTVRGGEFKAAQTALAQHQQRWSNSGYKSLRHFWMGNAHYALRQYKEAISAFRDSIADAPQSQRNAEAMLAIANCQLELKDSKAARKTLADLIKQFPQSEAAVAAKDRLKGLK